MNDKLMTCFKCGYVQRPKKLRRDEFGFVDKFYRRDPGNPRSPAICGQCHQARSYGQWKKDQRQETRERFNGEPEFDLGRHCDRRELEF